MTVTDLEGLDEGPEQVTDALRAVQQFDQTHDTEESEECDGNRGIFRGLWKKTKKRNRKFEETKLQNKNYSLQKVGHS